MPLSFNSKKDDQKKPKGKRLDRSAILTVTTLIIAVIVVTTAAIVSNRSKVPPLSTNPATSPQISRPAPTQPPSDTSPTDVPTIKPTDSAPVESKLPSFILPVSGTLSNRHDPELQVFSSTMNDYRVHLGIDIVTDENAPVYASCDGKVARIWVDPKMGYCMALEHSGKAVTIYKNLAADLPAGVVEGASVRSGQLIATVGESAMVELGEEPHLHFEMTVSDLSVDPLKYFDENSLKAIGVNNEN